MKLFLYFCEKCKKDNDKGNTLIKSGLWFDEIKKSLYFGLCNNCISDKNITSVEYAYLMQDAREGE